MQPVLNIEEDESSLPILCLYGDESELRRHLVDEFKNKFRIILISSLKPEYIETASNSYFLNYENSELLPKLEEIIDYSLVLLNDKTPHAPLTPLFTKLTKDGSHNLIISTVQSITHNTQAIKEYLNAPFTNFALMGELMSRGVGKGVTSKIIENAISNGEIRLEGTEIFPVFLISKSDVTTGISRLLFGNFKKDILYCLFYKHPHTVLETAHLLGRVLSDLKIIFSEHANRSSDLSHEDVGRVVKESFGMEEGYLDFSYQGFEKSIQLLSQEVPLEHDDKPVKKSRKRGRKKAFFSAFKFTLLSLFFGTFIFVFVNFLFLGLGLFFLQNTLNDLANGNFKGVSTNVKTSHFFLETIKPTASIAFEVLGSMDKNGQMESAYLLAGRAGELSKIAGDTFLLLLKSGSPSENTLTSVSSNFSFLYQEGQRIVLETGNKNLKDRLNETYSKLLSFSEVLPEILGFDSEKEYLLLFQNDEELRPTGGFIGSVGDLRVKEGKVQNLTVQDVYELDGQLRTHVEPPFVVRRYLQPHLYLRDSNFFLNFQETASTSAYIYNLESGKKPDAVIGIDLKVLREILKLSGPLKLPGYNVTVTDKNISDFFQSTIQNNFFPGSTQKRDVLTAVANQLIAKTSHDRKFNFSLVKLLPKLLEEKDILVSFSNSSIQKVFAVNNYSGEYANTILPGQKNINDFLYINEANIGVNKVNAQINRRLSYEVMLGEGKTTSKATLTLDNKSQKDDYKVYVTLAVPQSSVLKEVWLGGQKQTLVPAVIDPKIYGAAAFQKPDGLEAEHFVVGNIQYFAFLAIIPKGLRQDIVMIYDNGVSKSLPTVIDYSLQIIKQPGISPYPATITVDYPDGYVPVQTKASTFGNNFLEIEDSIAKDYEAHVELHKQNER